MALRANGLTIIIVVTGQTVIHIHFCLARVTAAVAQVGPAGCIVRARHNQTIAMAGDARFELLMTAVAIVALVFGVKGVTIHIIQWMYVTVQVVFRMAIQTLFLRMAHFAIVFIKVSCQSMCLTPVQLMVQGGQLFPGSVANLTIIYSFELIMAILAQLHRWQKLLSNRLTVFDAGVARGALYLFSDMFGVRKFCDIRSDVLSSNGIISIGVAIAALGIVFIVTGEAVLVTGNHIVFRAFAFQGRMAIAAFDTGFFDMKFMRKFDAGIFFHHAHDRKRDENKEYKCN